MISPDPTPPKWSRRPPRSDARSSTGWSILLAVCCALALGYAVYHYFHRPAPSPGNVKAPAASVTEYRMVSLFFPLSDGSGLSGIIQKRPDCADEPACLADILLALSENPGAGFFPLFTFGSTPPTVRIEGATATINFERETIQQLPGGVQSERLILAALVDTMAVNFPRVKQLAIEIDGIPAETLKGHIDLSTPFAADFSLVRRPLLPSFPVKSGTHF